MPDLSRGAIAPRVDLAVNDHPAAHADIEEEVEQVLVHVHPAEVELRQGGSVGIVLHEYWEAEPAGENRTDFHVVPAQHQRVLHQPPPAEHAGDSDPDAVQPDVTAYPGADVANHRGHPLDDRGRIPGDKRLRLRRKRLDHQVEGDHPDDLYTDLHADEVSAVRVELDARAGPPRRPRGGRLLRVDKDAPRDEVRREEGHCGAGQAEPPRDLRPGLPALEPKEVQDPGLVDSLDVVRTYHGCLTRSGSR